MKHRFYACISALLFAAVLTTTLPAAAKPLDGIVAVVGEDVILASELNAAVQQKRRRLGDSANSVPVNVLRSNVLDEIIITKLQLDRAQELGLKIGERELNRGMARLAQQNGMRMNQFMQALRRRGIPLKSLKQRVRENLLIRKVRRKEVLEDIDITKQDVTRFLESRSLRSKNNLEYHLRHIRINIPATADDAAVEQARQRIKRMRAKAVSGEATFAALAKTRSDGKNAERGGNMGWIGSAFMPRVFMDVVPGLDDGEISQVFRGAGAFHLVKLMDTRGSQTLAGNKKVMVDQVKVRRIVLKPNALRNKKRTRKLAVEIRERLKAGANFADLARQYSDNKATAGNGGELGWTQPQRLGPREAVRVAKMQPGDVSPILETNKGFVIMKLVDRRQSDKTREAIRKRARQILGRRKAKELGRRWLQKLRSEAYVDIRLEGYRSNSG